MNREQAAWSRGCSKAVTLALVLCVYASGQETRGTLTGKVLDSTGALVPGAEVEVIHLAMGTKTTTATNDSGNYVIPYLSNGHTGFRLPSRDSRSGSARSSISAWATRSPWTSSWRSAD